MAPIFLRNLLKDRKIRIEEPFSFSQTVIAQDDSFKCSLVPSTGSEKTAENLTGPNFGY